MKSNIVIELIENCELKDIYRILRRIEVYLSKIHGKLHDKEFVKIIEYFNEQLETVAFIDSVIDGYDNTFYSIRSPFIYYNGEDMKVDFVGGLYIGLGRLLTYDIDYVVFRGELYEI